MSTLLGFVARISPILYALAAVGIFFSIRGLVQSRRARRVAVFGLEREAAQEQWRRSLSAFITLVLLAVVVYIIDNILVPNMESVAEEVPTATPVAFVTPEATPTEALLLFPTVTPTVGLPPAEAAALEETPQPEVVNGCEIIGATITSPEAGDTVSGQVAVEGEANVLNFAQYKFEIRGPSTGDAWVVVGSYLTPVPNGLLGVWDSTSLLPGNYTLRLIVHRQDGTYVTPCEVPIVVQKSSVVPPSGP